MNAYKKILRIWITFSSFIGFLVGWVFLSRTVDTNTITYVGNTAVQMPDLPSIPAVGDTSSATTSNNNVQFFTVNTSQQSSAPMFRTGGS